MERQHNGICHGSRYRGRTILKEKSSMGNVKRVYVEKKEPFAVKARELKEEIGSYLGIGGVQDVRVFIRYDVERALSTWVWTMCSTLTRKGGS